MEYGGGSGTPSVMSLYDDGIGGIEGVDTNLALQLLFQYYCRFGRSGKTTELETMDNAMFAKFLRDTPCLLDRRLTPTEGDLIFFKCKEKASRRINYSQVSNKWSVEGCCVCACASALLPISTT
jgi:hypothetical protein